MAQCTDLRVVFRAPAGARRGFGHLVRCRTLARALGVRPLLALRGSRRVVETALALGCDVVPSPRPRVLAALRPDLLVIDDPVAANAKRWAHAGRRVGCAVASVHDLSIGCLDTDLVIDGSVTRTSRARRARGSLTGPRYAVIDPRVQRRSRRQYAHPSLFIALGGGPHATTARAIAGLVVAAHPRIRVRIAAGFVTSPAAATPRIEWIWRREGLTTELARADVAITGGGVSLYEACALGVPVVGVPVVGTQSATVEAFARQGAALATRHGASPEVAAAAVLELLGDVRLRNRLSRVGRRLVDGRGAERVARALTRLACQVASLSAGEQ